MIKRTLKRNIFIGASLSAVLVLVGTGCNPNRQLPGTRGDSASLFAPNSTASPSVERNTMSQPGTAGSDSVGVQGDTMGQPSATQTGTTGGTSGGTASGTNPGAPTDGSTDGTTGGSGLSNGTQR